MLSFDQVMEVVRNAGPDTLTIKVTLEGDRPTKKASIVVDPKQWRNDQLAQKLLEAILTAGQSYSRD